MGKNQGRSGMQYAAPVAPCSKVISGLAQTGHLQLVRSRPYGPYKHDSGMEPAVAANGGSVAQRQSAAEKLQQRPIVQLIHVSWKQCWSWLELIKCSSLELAGAGAETNGQDSAQSDSEDGVRCSAVLRCYE